MSKKKHEAKPRLADDPSISDDPRLDALDPLAPKAEAEPESVEDQMTPEERAQFLREGAERARPKVEAQAALEAMAREFEGAENRGDVILLAKVKDAVEAAEAAGVFVNRAMFVEIGALDTPTAIDIDAPAEAQPAPPEEEDEIEIEVSPDPLPADVVDPLVLPEDRHLVPIYNPMPTPITQQYGGRFYNARGGGVSLVHIEAANLMVGADNGGGTFSRFGVRRLYGPEPRFAEVAEKAGLSIEAWCRKRNEAIRFTADGVASKAPRLAPPKPSDLDLEE